MFGHVKANEIKAWLRVHNIEENMKSDNFKLSPFRRLQSVVVQSIT
jgi:hypothetical protein